MRLLLLLQRTDRVLSELGSVLRRRLCERQWQRIDVLLSVRHAWLHEWLAMLLGVLRVRKWWSVHAVPVTWGNQATGVTPGTWRTGPPVRRLRRQSRSEMARRPSLARERMAIDECRWASSCREANRPHARRDSLRGTRARGMWKTPSSARRHQSPRATPLRSRPKPRAAVVAETLTRHRPSSNRYTVA